MMVKETLRIPEGLTILAMEYSTLPELTLNDLLYGNRLLQPCNIFFLEDTSVYVLCPEQSIHTKRNS